MFSVITCKDYSVESSHNSFEEALKACREAEKEAIDGITYARVISHNGVFVGDADGKFPPLGSYIDHATQTGMYDHD